MPNGFDCAYVYVTDDNVDDLDDLSNADIYDSPHRSHGELVSTG